MGSNPTGCCCVDHSSRILPSVMCLSFGEAPIKGSPGTLGDVAPLKGKDETIYYEVTDKKNPKI